MTICTKHSYGGPEACPYCALAEAAALLERCLPLAPIGSELRSFIRDWLRGLSRAPAQPAAPTPRKSTLDVAHNMVETLAAERAAHAETRKALELTRNEVADADRNGVDVAILHLEVTKELESTRAELATVTAERDGLLRERGEQRGWYTKVVERYETIAAAERAAHAEIRAALERQDRAVLSMNATLESTRAELTKSETRVKELEAENARLAASLVRNGITHLNREAI